MSPAPDQQAELPPEVDENLVAYLDGELDDEAIQKIEARLARDAGYRQELARLQSAWDCLDVLPETNINPAFTRSTIEMVALAAEAELAETRAALPKMQRIKRWRNLALMVAAAGIGFVLVTVLWPSPTRQLARDLPVLENLDLYLPVDNLAYLRQISTLDDLPKLAELASESKLEATTGEESREGATATTKTTGSASIRLASMTPIEKAQLAVSEQRFARLQPAEQARLRELARQLEQAPDRDQLRETLLRYHAWLADLSPGAQADLAGLVPAERIEAVRKLMAEEKSRRSHELSASDRKVLLEFMESYVRSHREELLKQIPELRRREMGRWIEQAEPQQQSGMLMMMLWQRSRSGEQGLKMPLLSDSELQSLLDKLSPAARQQWDKHGTTEERRRLLQSWVSMTLRQRMMDRASTRDARQLTQEQLEDFFATELSSEQRARLLAMPREEMDRELRRLLLDGQEGQRWRTFDGGRPGTGFGRDGFGPPPPPPGEGPGPAGFRPEKHPMGRGPEGRPDHERGPREGRPDGERHREGGPRFERGPQGEDRPMPRREGGPGAEGGSRRMGRPPMGDEPKATAPAEEPAI